MGMFPECFSTPRRGSASYSTFVQRDSGQGRLEAQSPLGSCPGARTGDAHNLALTTRTLRAWGEA